MSNRNLLIARQQFAQCVFNHKVHESASERNETCLNRITKFNIAIVSLVLILLIIQLICPRIQLIWYLSTSLTVFEVVFLIIQLSFDYQGKFILHKNSALKYMNLRDEYKNLIVDIYDNKFDDISISNKRDLLQSKYQTIAELSPQTTSQDYKKSQMKLFGKIKSWEEFTWSDNEIDKFLPDGLGS